MPPHCCLCCILVVVGTLLWGEKFEFWIPSGRTRNFTGISVLWLSSRDKPLGCSLTLLREDRSLLSCRVQASLFCDGFVVALSEYAVLWHRWLQSRSIDLPSYCPNQSHFFKSDFRWLAQCSDCPESLSEELKDDPRHYKWKKGRNLDFSLDTRYLQISMHFDS